MIVQQLSNDFQDSGTRKKIDGIILHSIAKYFHRSILLDKPYCIAPDLVEMLDEVVFAPDFLEFVGKHARQSWLKGSADFFVDSAGKSYRYKYDRITWHAGVSRYRTWSSLNKNFAGLECMVGDEPFKHYGHFLSEINSNQWLFTEAMYLALAEECKELMKEHSFPSQNVVTHQQVAGDHIRGNGKGKQDPGAAFNFGYFKSLLA